MNRGQTSAMRLIRENHIVLEGIRTRELSVDGEGPPILLLHGFTDSADTWRPVLTNLAGSRRVIAVDLPGSGRADPLPRGPVLEPFDRFLAAFIRPHAGTTGVVVAGNSLGGSASLRAAQNPELPILAVAGLAPGGLVATRHLERASVAGLRLRPILRVAYRAPVPGVVLRAAAAQFYERRLGGDRESSKRYASHFRGVRDVRRIGATMAVLAAEMAEGCLQLDRITTPVLLIWGRRDPLLSVRGAHMVLDAVPESKLIVFDDCGHCPQQEKPDVVASLIAALPESTRELA
ncbi:alpha/beta hydrolase [Mycobacterium syngnathidarum]